MRPSQPVPFHFTSLAMRGGRRLVDRAEHVVSLLRYMGEQAPGFRGQKGDEYDSHVESIGAHARRLHNLLIDMGGEGRQPDPDAILSVLSMLEMGALAALHVISAPPPAGFPEAKAARLRQAAGSPSSETMVLEYHRRVLSALGAAAISVRRSLEQVIAPRTEDGPKSGAERARVLRDRARRKVAFLVPVEIYEDDLNLLDEFGLLDRGEREDRVAVASAVEALVLGGFLMFPLDRGSSRGRLRRQASRLKALDPPEDNKVHKD